MAANLEPIYATHITARSRLLTYQLTENRCMAVFLPPKYMLFTVLSDNLAALHGKTLHNSNWIKMTTYHNFTVSQLTSESYRPLEHPAGWLQFICILTSARLSISTQVATKPENTHSVHHQKHVTAAALIQQQLILFKQTLVATAYNLHRITLYTMQAWRCCLWQWRALRIEWQAASWLRHYCDWPSPPPAVRDNNNKN